MTKICRIAVFMSATFWQSLVKIGLKTKKNYHYAKFWQDPFLDFSDSRKINKNGKDWTFRKWHHTFTFRLASKKEIIAMKSSLMESCLFWTKKNFVIFKRWSGWSKYYRCWIIPAGKTCRSLNLTKRFPFTHYNIPWLHLILTVMIPCMKYYTSIPNQLPFVEKNFPYWKMSLQNLGQECWDGLCVGESLMRKNQA